MTYKLTFALTTITLLFGLPSACEQPCVPDFECQEADNPLDTDSDWDSDWDSDSDSESQNEKDKKPFIWMPDAVCEDGMWTFSAELREIQTDKVWVELYYYKGEDSVMTLLPLYKMENNTWISSWSVQDYELPCNRNYRIAFLAQNSHGLDRVYWQYTFSE
jgi:hypothetical protein